MPQKPRPLWTSVALAAVAGASLSACASTRPAPIQFAGATPKAAIIPSPARSAAVATPAAPRRAGETPVGDLGEPVIISDLPPLECVPYARNRSGIQIWGDAVTWWAKADGKYIRSSRPAEGSVLVLKGFNDANRGHVSVVTALLSERVMLVDHSNWLARGEISLNVPVADVSPDNDWSQVRVWHIPGGYWGGRTYLAEGFIHPFGLAAGTGASG